MHCGRGPQSKEPVLCSIQNQEAIAMRISQVLLLTVGVSTAMTLSAQENPASRTTTGQDPMREQTTSRGQNATEADGILATWLLVENNNEIALSQIAQQRAQDPEVKQFAQSMVEAHRQMAQGLQPFAGDVGFSGSAIDASAPLSRPTDPKTTGTDPKVPETDPQPTATDPKPMGTTPAGVPQEAGAGRTTDARTTGLPSMQHLDHVALLKELGRECLASSREALEQKQGAEFDRCYVGMAIGAHMKANDAMTVFQRHASTDLAIEIGKAQRMVASHLEQAKALGKRLEGQKPAAAISEK
jgi:predicted outer membrane protein